MLLSTLRPAAIKVFVILALFFTAASYLLSIHYEPWYAVQQNLSAYYALLFLAALVLFFRRLQLTKMELSALLLLLLLYFSQYTMGITYYFGEMVVFSAYTLGFAFAVWLGRAIAQEPIFLKQFFVIFSFLILFIALASLYLALQQWLFANASIKRPYANFNQPNNFATFLGMGLAALLYLFEKRYFSKPSALLIALFILLGLALAQSRTTWLSFIVLLFFWLWKQRHLAYKPRLRTVHLLLLLVAFIGFLLLIPQINELLFGQTADLLARASSSSRLNMYQQFVLAIAHGPWYGYGLGQVVKAQIAISPLHMHYEITYYTHNLILDTLIWFGPVFGGAISVLAAIWIIKIYLKAISLEAFVACVACLFILLHSMLEYPYAYAFFLLPLGLYLGLAQSSFTAKSLLTIPKAVMVLTLLAGFTMTSWLAYEYALLKKDYNDLRIEAAHMSDDKADQQGPNILFLTQLADYNHLWRTQPESALTWMELERLRIAAYHNPFSPNFVIYIKALAWNGYIDETIEQLATLKLIRKPFFSRYLLHWLERNSTEHPEFHHVLKHFGEGANDG